MKNIHIFSPATGQILNSFNDIETAVKFAKVCLRDATRVNLPASKFTLEIGTIDKKIKGVSINAKGEITIYSINQ